MDKVKRSAEQERIESIKKNGGRHLQRFKPENITYEMCCLAVELNGTAIEFVPDRFLTQEIYEKACKSWGGVLPKVPSEFVTEDMCKNAVKSVGAVIDYVPERFLSEKMYFLAVCSYFPLLGKIPECYITTDFVCKLIKRCGKRIISSLPKKFRTAKFYLPIVEQFPEIIWELPKAAHTVAVCKAAIGALGYKTLTEAVIDNPVFLGQMHESMYDHEACLAFVHSEYFKEWAEKESEYGLPNIRLNGECIEIGWDRTGGICSLSGRKMLMWIDICEAFLAVDPKFFQLFNPECITKELCMKAIAVSEYGNVIEYFPEKYLTEDICSIALAKDSYNLKYIPQKVLSSIDRLSEEQNAVGILKYAPQHYITYEICTAAVTKYASALKNVPKELIDKKLCLIAIENGGYYGILQDIPESCLDYDVFFAAVRNVFSAFDDVPDEYLTYDLCFEAVKKGISVSTVKRIPEEYFTEELCAALVSHSNNYFEYIPKTKLTTKVCMQAIRQGKWDEDPILGEVPKSLITQEMCEEAMKTCSGSIECMPEEYITESMLIDLARNAPGLITEKTFPKRLRTANLIEELRSINEYAVRFITK